MSFAELANTLYGGRADAPKKEPRRWSYSALEDYQSCGEKFRLRRVDKVAARVFLNASAGSAVHTWSEHYDFHRLGYGDIKPWDECLEEAVQKDEERSGHSRDKFSVSGRGKETYEYWRDELGPEICARYVDWWTEQSRDGSYSIATNLPPDSNGTTVGIEYCVECFIGGTEYKGFIDRILRDAEGNLILVDLKAGARKQTTLQLPSYLVAARKNSINATAASIYYARKGQLEEPQSFANYSEATLAEVYDTARTQEARGEYAPRPSADCGWCSVRDYCKFRLK